ncbi:hypothetical protein PAXRUDRAFT_591712 [Paxillus rubicundulus Ve08.2h10]|uniref:DUF6534 domain-containing protein n=1 Tax=Paxillus rubicundulus Ve08.2h10 TaxID=930991 RepID=A0A0D0D5W5_9AGAM|nr:hypothetical protein PAXRUDRAFT_591712 [Paxillus rubicundulus Ve08.2h10]
MSEAEVLSSIDNSGLPSDVPVAFGYALSILLYGILIVQTFIYYTRFSKDSRRIRIYVWMLFGLETVSLAFVLFEMLQGASIRCLVCIPLSILSSWSFEVISVLTGLISLMVHGFYCWRIRVMSRSWYIPIFVMVTSLVQCIFLGLDTMTVGLLGGPSSWIWMIADFLCDLIITIEIIRLLFRRSAASPFKHTRDLVTQLIKLTIETGAVTTVAMLLLFSLSWGGGASQFSIFYSISRLYANCLLATLNARLVISKDSTRVHQVSTILFDVPPPSGVSECPADNYINVTIGQSQLDMGSLMDAGDDTESVFVGGTEKPNHEGVSEV